MALLNRSNSRPDADPFNFFIPSNFRSVGLQLIFAVVCACVYVCAKAFASMGGCACVCVCESACVNNAQIINKDKKMKKGKRR